MFVEVKSFSFHLMRVDGQAEKHIYILQYYDPFWGQSNGVLFHGQTRISVRSRT